MLSIIQFPSNYGNLNSVRSHMVYQDEKIEVTTQCDFNFLDVTDFLRRFIKKKLNESKYRMTFSHVSNHMSLEYYEEITLITTASGSGGK